MTAILVDKKGFTKSLYQHYPSPAIKIPVYQSIAVSEPPIEPGLTPTILTFLRHRCIDPSLDIWEYREL